MLQPDRPHTRVILFKFQDVTNAGTSEAVDSLVVISHNADSVVLSRYLINDLKLCLIGILILIDHHILKELLILGSDRFISLQELCCIEQNIVKVQRLV